MSYPQAILLNLLKIEHRTARTASLPKSYLQLVIEDFSTTKLITQPKKGIK
jgi:hypothetical protein